MRCGLTLFTYGVVVTCGFAPLAYAQSAPAEGPSSAPSEAPVPAVEPSAPPGAPPAPACVPACRDGYVCHEGRCLEACNPPCPAGTRCTGAAECVAEAPPPPPAYSAAPPTPPSEPSEEDPGPPPGPDPGAERHDGFMLRLTLGIGGGSVTASAAGADTTYNGPAGSFTLDIGGTPTENLIIHGRFGDFGIIDPSVTGDGVDPGSRASAAVASFLLGPAVTYYFMPANLYLTGAVGLSDVEVSVEGADTDSSNTGVAVNVDAGKEWWVGDNWGIGLVARFWYTHASDDSTVDETLDLLGGALAFSATYQ